MATQSQAEQDPLQKGLIARARESVVAPAIDAAQRSSVVALAINTRDTARAVSDSPHMAPIHAAVRQGADEIAQVLTAFPANGVQPVSEQGQLFEPTPQLVTEQMTGRLGMDDLRQYAAGRAAEASKAMEGQTQQQERGRGM
jgi:hypothetical protein